MGKLLWQEYHLPSIYLYQSLAVSLHTVFTDVSIQVNKALRIITTLADLGCFACDLGEGRTAALTVLV